MSKQIETVKKVAARNVALKAVLDGPWAGSRIAEAFEAGGDTRMSCGIHEILSSDTRIERSTVDDILFVLEGEIEIESEDSHVKLKSGDFVYLRAGCPMRFIVRKRVKHLYVTYPANWKQEK